MIRSSGATVLSVCSSALSGWRAAYSPALFCSWTSQSPAKGSVFVHEEAAEVLRWMHVACHVIKMCRSVDTSYTNQPSGRRFSLKACEMFPAGLRVGRCRGENMLLWKQINRNTEKGLPRNLPVYNGVWRILQPTSWALIWWRNALKRVPVTQMMPKTEYSKSCSFCFFLIIPLTGPWCSAVFAFSQGLGAESKNLYPFLLPVIQLSTDVSQPPHVYLLEDGLELW